MRGGIEGLLRAADRFQQRHTMFAIPIGVAKKFGDDQAGKHAALAETEERRPEEIVEVRFSSEADGRHGRQP